MVLRQIGSGIARMQTHSTVRAAAYAVDVQKQATSAIRRAENIKRFRPQRQRESETHAMAE